jgi:hypothetical protein
MPEPVVPQPAVVPAAPPVPEHNPYAPYGLDAQGNPLPAKKAETPKSDPMADKIASLEATIAQMGESLKETDSIKKQLSVIDRVVKAVSGGEDVTDPRQYKAIFDDLKKISPPGVQKLLNLLENDPGAVERMTGAVETLHVNQLVGINAQAHERVVDLAKKAGFRASNEADMNKMVFPFERAITEVVNANPKLKQAFLTGNVDVIDEVFNSLVSPHISQRVREKQARQSRGIATKTPPFGKAAPGETKDAPTRPDIRTPQGRAAFHKQAVGRFFDKVSAKDDE